MFNVQIKKGIYRNNEISGSYVATKTWFPAKLNPECSHLGDGKIFVMIDGSERGVWVFKSDIVMEGVETTPVAVVESTEDMKTRINKRFKVMNMMTNGIIDGKIRSLII